MTHLPIITPSIFHTFGFIRCAISTRRGGVSAEPYGMNLSFNVGDQPEKVRENRRIFLDAVGCEESLLAQPRQRHTAVVLAVKEPGWVDGADALVTDRGGLWLGISVADCLPVFLVDPVHRAIAAIHAGWRGTAGRIVQNTVHKMEECFGTVPSAVVAFLGPSARSCCYEVGPEVAGQFDEGVVEQRGGNLYLDILRENAKQLRQVGIPEENIEISGLCTITEKEILHSYRRDGSRSGRMLGVIAVHSDRSI